MANPEQLEILKQGVDVYRALPKPGSAVSTMLREESSKHRVPKIIQIRYIERYSVESQNDIKQTGKVIIFISKIDMNRISEYASPQ
jgi:hypothetical protein